MTAGRFHHLLLPKRIQEREIRVYQFKNVLSSFVTSLQHFTLYQLLLVIRLHKVPDHVNRFYLTNHVSQSFKYFQAVLEAHSDLHIILSFHTGLSHSPLSLH